MFTFKKQKPLDQQPRVRQRVESALPSNAVFSYHANRTADGKARDRNVDQQPSETVERTLAPKPLWRQSKTLLAIVVVVAGLLYIVSLDRQPKIVIMGDTSSKIFIHSQERYRQTAQALLKQSFLNSNKLTIDTTAISNGLQTAFPEIHTATVTLPVFGHQAVIYIQTAVPQMVLATQHDGQFILDNTGRALVAVSKQTPLPTGNQALAIVQDESGLSVKLGQIALPRQSVAAIVEVAGQLRAKQLTAATWRLPAQTSELDVTLSGTPYAIRFNLRADTREEAGAFLAAKNYLDARHITPGQYIDVRLNGRVYYL